MSNLGNLTCSNRSLLNLYCLMHAADTKATKVVLLTLCLAVAANNFGNLELCHNRVLLTVENFAHRNATETGHSVGVPHLGKSGNSGFHEVVRVG